MKLPNAGQAIAEVEKLSDYCLDPGHPRGRHKARVFDRVLGITGPSGVKLLRRQILEKVIEANCRVGEKDVYGQRYTVDIQIAGPKGRAMVRTAWIVRTGEAEPRLTSCYVR